MYKSNSQNPFPQEEYWMVTGTWMQLYKMPPKDGIVGSGEEIVQRVYSTEVTNVHPALHCAKMAKERADYAILETLPISKKIFDWVMVDPTQKQVAKIAGEVEKENQPDNVVNIFSGANESDKPS